MRYRASQQLLSRLIAACVPCPYNMYAYMSAWPWRPCRQSRKTHLGAIFGEVQRLLSSSVPPAHHGQLLLAVVGRGAVAHRAGRDAVVPELLLVRQPQPLGDGARRQNETVRPYLIAAQLTSGRTSALCGDVTQSPVLFRLADRAKRLKGTPWHRDVSVAYHDVWSPTSVSEVRTRKGRCCKSTSSTSSVTSSAPHRSACNMHMTNWCGGAYTLPPKKGSRSEKK